MFTYFSWWLDSFSQGGIDDHPSQKEGEYQRPPDFTRIFDSCRNLQCKVPENQSANMNSYSLLSSTVYFCTNFNRISTKGPYFNIVTFWNRIHLTIIKVNRTIISHCVQRAVDWTNTGNDSEGSQLDRELQFDFRDQDTSATDNLCVLKLVIILISITVPRLQNGSNSGLPHRVVVLISLYNQTNKLIKHLMNSSTSDWKHERHIWYR